VSGSASDSDDESTITVPPAAGAGVPVRRVRKAYEQVADQLRDLIMAGDLRPGHRLPNESSLSREFGVSRATVREALRVLAAQDLIRTAKGASGGSFITMPSVDHISAFLSSNLGLLSRSEDFSLDEFLEARMFLEVPAVRLAARRRDDHNLEALRDAIPEEPLELGTSEQFLHNKDFHSALVIASGNKLLSIASQPVFAVLQTNLRRSTLGRHFHQQVNHDHREILAAVEASDEDAAARLMEEHLKFLAPQYAKAWRFGHDSDG
jgi:GntR family transcriptional repressor for pyruvate dehydrogenase complex